MQQNVLRAHHLLLLLIRVVVTDDGFRTGSRGSPAPSAALCASVLTAQFNLHLHGPSCKHTRVRETYVVSSVPLY